MRAVGDWVRGRRNGLAAWGRKRRDCATARLEGVGISAKARRLVLVSLVLGVLFLIAGGENGGLLSDYWDGVAANFGVGLVLAAPLILVERTIVSGIRQRVSEAEQTSQDAQLRSQDAQEQVDAVSEETRDALSAVSEGVRQGIDRQRRRDDELRADMLTAPSFENLLALFGRAKELGAIDRRGIRTRVRNTDVWVRARAIQRQPQGLPLPAWFIEIGAELMDGTSIPNTTMLWESGQAAAIPLGHVAQGLTREGRFPGQHSFQGGQVLGDLTDGLFRAIEIRTRGLGGGNVRPVIELLREDWALTRGGLDSLHNTGRASAHELDTQAEDTYQFLKDQLGHHQYEPALRTAFEVARAYHRRQKSEERQTILKDLFKQS